MASLEEREMQTVVTSSSRSRDPLWTTSYDIHTVVILYENISCHASALKASGHEGEGSAPLLRYQPLPAGLEPTL